MENNNNNEHDPNQQSFSATTSGSKVFIDVFKDINILLDSYISFDDKKVLPNLISYFELIETSDILFRSYETVNGYHWSIINIIFAYGDSDIVNELIKVLYGISYHDNSQNDGISYHDGESFGELLTKEDLNDELPITQLLFNDKVKSDEFENLFNIYPELLNLLDNFQKIIEDEQEYIDEDRVEFINNLIKKYK